MDPKFVPSLVEEKLYAFWESKGFFKADVKKDKKPFSIILPPPNANADLHLGHAMYVYEDIMVRYRKLLGDEVLWLPGADHAGFETQFVFEKHLRKEGKSRLDYNREELFQMIWDFVMKNKEAMENQLRKLGFALDWSKKKFTLDADVTSIVYETFKKLFDQELVYRAKRLVNYCTFCGTSFSDLEVVYTERQDPLYYIKYGPFVLATTRPETKFGDTAVAVSSGDKRYRQWIGKTIEVEGLNGVFSLKVVADDAVDPKFGTGVVKVTPAHDFTDFEIGQRHNLEVKQVIDFNGRLNDMAGPYAGMKVLEARAKIVEDMKAKRLIEKIREDYTHRVGTCYKCNRVIEPLPKEQWFVKIRPLTEKAEELVEKEEIVIYPKRFKKILLQWLRNFRDWNISRQNVWGIRIPAYKCKNSKFRIQNSEFSKQKKWFVSVEKPQKCQICGECEFEQDSDTFDTWFSSAQWPFATLKSCSNDFFNYFYPTSVMETGYDILPWWVARMIMIGYFATGTVPFRTVFLHGLVRDKEGKKMSKSKGNVVNPMAMVDKYGADALRAALVFGVREGGDVIFSEEKVIGMRNFANKIWNVGRFIYINSKSEIRNPKQTQNEENIAQKPVITSLKKECNQLEKKYGKLMDSYKFSQALGEVYEFLWHRFADYYIEELKEEMRNGNIKVLEVLEHVYRRNLKMLHPFMPFVTEAVWKVFYGEEKSIVVP